MVTSHLYEQDYIVSEDHYLDQWLTDPYAEQAFTDDLTCGLGGGGPLMLMVSAT
jgi:beta-galactosidase